MPPHHFVLFAMIQCLAFDLLFYFQVLTCKHVVHGWCVIEWYLLLPLFRYFYFYNNDIVDAIHISEMADGDMNDSMRWKSASTYILHMFNTICGGKVLLMSFRLFLLHE
jgi:hypothetical protein